MGEELHITVKNTVIPAVAVDTETIDQAGELGRAKDGGNVTAAPEHIGVIDFTDTVSVSGVDIGEAECTRVGQVRVVVIFHYRASGIDGQYRQVVSAGNGEADGLGVAATIVVSDGHIKA